MRTFSNSTMQPRRWESSKPVDFKLGHYQFSRLGLKFRSLFGRPLQLIDCQNLFCEVDKYARYAHPEVIGVTGRTLWFSGGNEGIGRYLGDNSDWSESSQIAYYLYITI